MSRLDDIVNNVLSAPGAFAAPGAPEPGVPWPVARWSGADRGAVLLLLRRRTGELHALAVAATRIGAAGWEIDSLAGMQWVTDEPVRPAGPDVAVPATLLLSGLAVIVGATRSGVGAVAVADLGTAPVEPGTGAFVVAVPSDAPLEPTIRPIVG